MFGLRRITRRKFNLIPESVEALNWAVAVGGDTETDTVNRALQVYALVLGETCDGSGTLAIRRPDGTVDDVMIT